ncbi:Conserved_hypothetical protein [Hexamita inflata]|uniref:Uncharacterized protein n=1 Tax=Hexamita inflata TaxID=28002 RepID=A0AA86ULG8_9EUKA|nr:Conserved hypothetical protein [Hexamita inflata]
MITYVYSLLNCVQNISLSVQCSDIRRITVQNSNCLLQFVPPRFANNTLMCADVKVSDVSEIRSQILADDISDVVINIRVAVNSTQSLNFQNINIFTFQQQTALQLRNVTLNLEYFEDQPFQSLNLQLLQFNSTNKPSTELILNQFNIQTLGECSVNVNTLKTVDKRSYAFVDVEMNNTFICVDVDRAQVNSQLFMNYSSFRNIRIEAKIQSEQTQFSLLQQLSIEQTTVKNCYFDVKINAYSFDGLVQQQIHQMQVQNVYLSLISNVSYSSGIASASKAAVLVEAVISYQQINALHQASFLVNKGGYVLVKHLNLNVKEVKASNFGSVQYVQMLRMQHSNIVIENVLANGGILCYQTKLLSNSIIIIAQSHIEILNNNQYKVALIHYLQKRSILELQEVKGIGFNIIIRGKGDVFGEVSWLT